jgi:predicted DNA-binding transcriptional regulator YafY
MFQEFNKLEILDHLIFIKATGTRADLAIKLEVSSRTVSRYLEIMKLNGAEIRFNRSKNTFEYAKAGRFVVFIGFKSSQKELVS